MFLLIIIYYSGIGFGVIFGMEVIFGILIIFERFYFIYLKKIKIVKEGYVEKLI